MDEKVEELIPIVGRLAEEYTAYEHTSVPYEKAQQLMQAVLYCIHEAKTSGTGETALQGNMSPRQIYEAGVQCVAQKAQRALALYNKISRGFNHYGNCCLYDTVVKGLPEFFRWYDIKFCPQDTILTLDYPVLKDISGNTGIDKIYEFIVCIQIEQEFLDIFPESYVKDVWSKHTSHFHEDVVENLCEVVLMETIGHVLARKPLEEQDFTEADYLVIQKIWEQTGAEGIKQQMDHALELLIQHALGDCDSWLEYLSDAVDNILVRLGNAAGNGTLPNLF